MSAQTLERPQTTFAPDPESVRRWKSFVNDRTRVESLEAELPHFAQHLGEHAAAVSVLTAADNDAGSYKWRGAFNAAYEADINGADVLTAASAGNFGAGAVLAGAYFEKPVVLFIPRTTSPDALTLIRSKADPSNAHRVHIDASAADVDEAALMARVYSENHAATALMHPFDSSATMAGQGTMADDVLMYAPDTRRIVITSGGNGALSGMARRLTELGRADVELVAAQAEGSDGLEQSLRAGNVVNATNPNKLYRGAKVSRIGRQCLKVSQNYENLTTVTVRDEEVRDLAQLYVEQNEVLMRGEESMYEPTTLLAFAALRGLTLDTPTVVVGTGVNQSPRMLFERNTASTYVNRMMHKAW